MAIAVLVTIPEKDAQNLVRNLLEERVCACVNIIKGVESHFWWQGKIDTAQEVLLVIKTKEVLFGKLRTIVEHNHPYDIPEVISFKMDRLNQQYFDWLNKEANASPSA